MAFENTYAQIGMHIFFLVASQRNVSSIDIFDIFPVSCTGTKKLKYCIVPILWLISFNLTCITLVIPRSSQKFLWSLSKGLYVNKLRYSILSLWIQSTIQVNTDKLLRKTCFVVERKNSLKNTYNFLQLTS